ncbi:hypothetical protein TNCV_3829651 [Trichonephila clavipes]|nr:hypothetical protein TNCV_3829651 [Trichonephila clavipes]
MNRNHMTTKECFRTESMVMPNHIRAHVAMNYLTACQTLPWLPGSPDISPIEDVRDVMGRRLNLPGISSGCYITIWHVMSTPCIQARDGSTHY